MDGLEQFPSVTFQYNSLQNTLFTYARQTGIFLPMNAMQFFHVQQLTETFRADNYWLIGFIYSRNEANGCKQHCLFLTNSFPPM